jgi:membrane associated rhomboid family serine protease
MRTYRAVNLNVLWFLIALNVVIFVITLLRPEETIYFLGLNTAQLQAHPWTIITSMFVHDPIIWTHILFNMISLYFLGSFFLRAAGERSFLAVFFLGGLAGNLLVILYAHLTGFTIVGYGASGGVLALAGALAIMVPRVPVIIFPIPVPMPLWVAILIFFFILIILPMLVGGWISWQAHLGGFLLGLIAGLILKRRRRIHYF